MKIITARDGRKYERVSRWITHHTNYNPNKRNSLWDYVCDAHGNHPYSEKFDPASEKYLDYFRYDGRAYALDQFYALGSVWVCSNPIMYDAEDGKLGVIGAVDMDGDMFHPLYMEIEEGYERIRLYKEVTK